MSSGNILTEKEILAMYNTVEKIKSRLTIFDIAGRLGVALRGKNGLFHSPFREDRNPSFSISKDGKLFNDFATGDKGDIFDFYKLATRATFSEAKNACAEFCGFSTIDKERPARAHRPQRRYLPPEPKPTRPKVIISSLEWNIGSAKRLEALRGYSVEAQEIAFKRGIFGFCEYKGILAWIITDGAGRTAQVRRVDGLKWADAARGHKAETLKNSDCSIPAGLEAIKPFEVIALCEGSADFLAAFHFAYVNDCENDIAPLAMFGAQQSIAQEALNALKGKRVIVFPDVDAAGKEALSRWIEQIRQYAQELYFFNFEGFHRADGQPVKDLSDFMQLDPDEWENSRPYTNPFYRILKELI